MKDNGVVMSGIILQFLALKFSSLNSNIPFYGISYKPVEHRMNFRVPLIQKGSAESATDGLEFFSLLSPQKLSPALK